MTINDNISDEHIHHARECLQRSIGHQATATVMTMLTGTDTSNLATREDIHVLQSDIRAVQSDIRAVQSDMRSLIELMDKRFVAVENRIDHLEAEMSHRFTVVDIQMKELEMRSDIKLESLEHRMIGTTYRAINRHLTFSVTAMAAVSGMFTWLAR